MGGAICRWCLHAPATEPHHSSRHDGSRSTMWVCRECHDAVHLSYDPKRTVCEAKENKMAKKAKHNTETPAPDPVRTTDNGIKMRQTEKLKKREYHELLPCPIDIEQVTKSGETLAMLIRERDTCLEEKRAINAKFRERIQYFDERLLELGKEVEGKAEMRQVLCIDYLLPTNEIETVRQDTLEIVSTRVARPDELQLDMTEIAAKSRKQKGDGKEGVLPAPDPYGGLERDEPLPPRLFDEENQ